ncbi:MAG: exodeoxyribonuclease V subunit alpha [Candidatus Binatia bacterium]
MTVTLESLRAAGVLSPLDEHFARAVGRMADERRPEVLLAAALTSRHVGNGQVCVHLARLVESGRLVNAAGDPVEGAWPEPGQWLEALRSSPLVSDGSVATPLVLDDVGRLYLRRYWEHQARLAAAIRARATQVDSNIDGAWLRQGLDCLFPANGVSAESAEIDWQRIAALLAAQRRFCVISGGPGTGKTYTVVKILALLVEQALRASGRTLRVTLVAPTGKAAARLSESIQRAKNDLDCSEEVKNAIPEEAATIHRCLGTAWGSSTRFRHDADTPLLTDVVLIDEASMVDLALMSRLVAAVPPQARLILLGDKDQLASVEAGAVLGDICNTGVRRSYSRALVEDIARLTGDHLRLDADAPRATGIWDCIVQLTRSYRYGPESGIGALARAINAGDGTKAVAVLESSDYSDVALAEPAEDAGLSEALREAVLQGFQPFLSQQTAEQQLRALERFRVLCAHRRGPGGVEEVNQQIEQALAGAGLIRPQGQYYNGRPIIVTRNDYQLKLFNGDVGLITGDPAGAPSQRVAFFLGTDGEPRCLSPSRLPPHETVYAMSIHKSQGSEFDQVAVLLPPRISPVLSRELLYTAVTRARHRVTIHATKEVVEQAIARRVERASGLRDLLWG